MQVLQQMNVYIMMPDLFDRSSGQRTYLAEKKLYKRFNMLTIEKNEFNTRQLTLVK